MSTLVIVPFVGDVCPPEVMRALRSSSGGKKHGWTITPVQLPENDVTAYWECLRFYWGLVALSGLLDLMIVEHDIVVSPFVFDQLDECDSEFCSFPYWIGASYDYALGCVRFSRRLIARYPEAVDKARFPADPGGDGLPEGHWKRLDTRLYSWLQHPIRDVTLCKHWPPVQHLHHYAMEAPSWEHEQAAIAEFREQVAGA